MRLGGTRADSLARLDGASVDLLVVGAGIIGAATAWAAARAGATVAVVDQGDIAGATSSASSKLLHGGLRYLAMGDVGLVREAHAERRLNAEVIAPHLVSPLDFLVPIRAGSPVPLWKVRAGVFLYGLLARFADGRNGSLPAGEAVRRLPGLRPDGLDGTVLYHDHQTHDGRLTLSALQAAAGLDAVVAPYVKVADLRIAAGRVAGAELRDSLTGHEFHLTASAVVNASGPWVDRLRRMESHGAGTSVRLSKGAHLLMDAPDGWDAAVTTPLPAGRVSFAIPWEGMLLLGTTDEPFEGDPAGVAATDDDERQILDEAARSLDPALLGDQRVRSRFAGVRVLPLSGGGTAGTHRETVITVGPHGMVSVAGGKLTTWRRIGLEAATIALDGIGVRVRSQPPRSVPGAAPAAEVDRRIAAAWPRLDPDVRAALSRHHGTVALDMLERCREQPELLERIHAGGPDLWVQVPHAGDHEWAATAEDVTRRRTLVDMRGHGGDAVRKRVAALLAGAGV